MMTDKKAPIKKGSEMRTARTKRDGEVQSIEGGKLITKESDGGHVYGMTDAVAQYVGTISLKKGDGIHFEYEHASPDDEAIICFLKKSDAVVIPNPPRPGQTTMVNTLASKTGSLDDAVKEGVKAAEQKYLMEHPEDEGYKKVPYGTGKFQPRKDNPRIGWYACINSAIEIAKLERDFLLIRTDTTSFEEIIIMKAKRLHDFVEEQVKE